MIDDLYHLSYFYLLRRIMFNITILANVSVGITLVIAIVALLLGVGAGFFINYYVNMRKVNTSKLNATRIIEDAQTEAKILKREALQEVKEEAFRVRQEVDIEIKERRNEVLKIEERIFSKEEMLSKREEALERKQTQIDEIKSNIERKQRDIDLLKNDIERIKGDTLQELSRISGISREEAKNEIIKRYENEAKVDALKLVRDIEQEAKDNADKKAKEIITLAIQKCAVDHAQDVTVSVVSIPNEEIKGRIIGREGRNIRTFEQATGVELIIDDTPDAITLSGFDPVRREIGRIALEKLIMDGRIHPAKIEELVEKVSKDMALTIKEAGENAEYSVGIHNLHPELVKILGRLKYRTSYGQNCLLHSIEVANLAGLMAEELGADVNVAKRGGLLHDLGKAMDHETEGTHVSIGVELARKYKESRAVIHCIEAHHGEVPFNSIEAILVQVADAISSARPGARRESLENYIKRLEALEEIANSFEGVSKSFAIQAGREVRVIVSPDDVDDATASYLAKQIAKKIENQLDYPGQIKVNVIREVRKTEIAK